MNDLPERIWVYWNSDTETIGASKFRSLESDIEYVRESAIVKHGPAKINQIDPTKVLDELKYHAFHDRTTRVMEILRKLNNA